MTGAVVSQHALPAASLCDRRGTPQPSTQVLPLPLPPPPLAMALMSPVALLSPLLSPLPSPLLAVARGPEDQAGMAGISTHLAAPNMPDARHRL
jgi:hypothetical protein